MQVELLTPSDLEGFLTKVFQKVDELKPALANALDKYLTIQEIMEFTETKSDKTVRNWIFLGKQDRFGKVYKLEAEEFSPKEYRVLKSKLIEYGKIKDCVAVKAQSLKRSKAA